MQEKTQTFESLMQVRKRGLAKGGLSPHNLKTCSCRNQAVSLGIDTQIHEAKQRKKQPLVEPTGPENGAAAAQWKWATFQQMLLRQLTTHGPQSKGTSI